MSAVALLRGSVVHARLRPRLHRFRYGLTLLAIDLDRWHEIAGASRWLSADRPNLFSVRRADHGARDGSDPAEHVRMLLDRHGLSGFGARIVLVCQPRVLGMGFNPLALYFCHDATGSLGAVVHEVRNTFGEHHSYVMPVTAGGQSPHRWSCPKMFRVSPFLALSHRYDFRVSPLEAGLRVRIVERDADGTVLAAALKAEREPLTGRALLGLLVRSPHLGLKVATAIRWEALRLWAKGLRPVPQA